MKTFDFKTATELIDICTTNQCDIVEVMLVREEELFFRSKEESMAKMLQAWQVMKQSVKVALNEQKKSMGGFIGGEAKALQELNSAGHSLFSGIAQKAMMYAMGVMEQNAAMGLIVAAPTAGSSGVLPGVLNALQEEEGYSDEKMAQSLFVAAAIGYLITVQATVAGAEGGCQAEIGSATAMAAAAICYLRKEGVNSQINASSIALANLLGLVCDPIKGLVESPCQQRNASGTAVALVAAELSLAGISNAVYLDDMIKIMYQVGQALPESLRETALGGMASAPRFCNSCA